MARDITVTERVIKAARRWLALLDDDVDILNKAHDQEMFSRVCDLGDAIRAYEKHHGMRALKFRVRPVLKESTE